MTIGAYEIYFFSINGAIWPPRKPALRDGLVGHFIRERRYKISVLCPVQLPVSNAKSIFKSIRTPVEVPNR